MRVPAAAARTLNLLVLLRRLHPSMQVNREAARTRHRNGDILTLSNLPPGYDKEQISSLASLKARWPAEQWCFTPFVRECISMATLVYAHSTTILTKHGPSEVVEEHIFYALQVRTCTIYYKTNDRLKNIFHCI